MPQTKAEKPQFSFRRGFITEQSPLQPVEESALDMLNYEITPAGGLRRRKAITMEVGGVPVDTGFQLESDAAYKAYTWRNAGGDPDRTLDVVQLGPRLRLFTDSSILSVGALDTVIELDSFRTFTATDAQLRSDPVSITSGRGHLLVAGKYIDPFYVELSANTPQSTRVEIRIRDFVGVEDGVAWTTQPITLDDAHEYNLLNRGWNYADYEQYKTDKGIYPSKASLPWIGYIRKTDAGIQEGYGTREWSSDKLEMEAFGDASAPQGRLFLNPFDTTTGLSNTNPSVGNPGGTLSVVTWFGDLPGPVTIETATAHGLSSGDTIDLTGNIYIWRKSILDSSESVTGSLDGRYVVTISGANTFSIPVGTDLGGLFDGWVDQFRSLGQVSVSTAGSPGAQLSRVGGYVTYNRPEAVAFWAGRAWFAGTAHDKLADIVFYSQVAEGPANYSRCYQRNDPTSEDFNSLLPTDGGTIKIPGLHGVLGMESFGSSLFVFAKSGVWEIRGGQNGFTASEYLVRKVTDAEGVSKLGTCRTDSGIVFVSKRGLYAIEADQNSGLANAGSLTAARINTWWHDLSDSDKATAEVVYDDAQRKVYTRFPTEALVLDTKQPDGGAFYKISIPVGSSGRVLGALAVDSGDNANEARKVKFVWLDEDGQTITFCDQAQTTFVDISGEDTVPYFEATYDNTGDWHKKKFVNHYAYLFLKKTETGYVDNGFELIPVNQGSTFVQARWDWADHGNSGKFGSPQQVYRRSRIYTPTGADDEFNDGQPVVVARVKLRGSGRALSLYVYGEAGKDSHILGWTIQYGVA